MSKRRTTEEFKQDIYNKYGDKIEILSEYNGGTSPIDFIYHCEEHGDIHKTVNAKNISSNKTFQPCPHCANENKSKSNGVGRNTQELYDEFKEHVESKGGQLITQQWNKSKGNYEIKCNNEEHPIFTMTHDAIMNKGTWCPYCCGRKGNFKEEIEEILKQKDGTLLSGFTNHSNHIKIKCNKDGYIWDITPNNLKKGRWCYVCEMNYAEKNVWNFLKDKQYDIIPQYSFNDLKSNNALLRFDFAVFKNDNLQYIIEVDDSEHWGNHKSERRLKAQERDRMKDFYCENKSIPLFRMIFNDRDNKFFNEEWYKSYIKEQIENFEREVFNIES